MTADRGASPLLVRLLLLIFRTRITAPDSDTGLAQLAISADRAASVEEGGVEEGGVDEGGVDEGRVDDWRSAVADALQAGYIHDPVRLPAGALQCHWHLELTPKGVETARHLQAARPDPT